MISPQRLQDRLERLQGHGRLPSVVAGVLRTTMASLEEVCFELVDLANQRGGRDNSTVLVVRLAGASTADDPDDATAGV